MKAKNQS